MAYLGRSPSQGVRNRYYKTASGGETSISGSLTGGTLTFTDGNYVDVNLNGITLVAGTDYNTNTANTISGLTALTANDVVEIVVYDVFSVFSGNVNSDFSIGGNLSVTGTTTITGLTTTGDINFGDNDKAVFGAGSDMEIFHQGANSFIKDNGTGDLVLRTNGNNILLQNSNNQNMIRADSANGEVKLFHGTSSGVEKLATTSTGINIQGSAGATLKLTSTDTTGADTELLGQIDFVSSDSSTGSAGTQARIKGVYEDNGDSSGIAFLAGASTGSGTPTISEVMRIRHEGRVGIKTTAPDAALHVLDTSLPQTKIAYDSNRYMNIEHATIYNVSGASQSNSLKIASRGYNGGNDIIFATGGTDAAGSSEAERMKILSGGNVDISAGHLLLDSGYGINSGGNLVFFTSNSEMSRFDTSGNFLVGKTSSGSFTQASCELNNTGYVMCQRDNGAALFLSRGGTTSTGAQIALYNGNNQQGTLGNKVGRMYLGSFDTGLVFEGYFDNSVIPFSPDDQNIRDNAIDLGYGSSRFNDIYAGNTSIIGTSDENEKEQIASLTTAEITAAKAISKLFKTFKWKDRVATKGDAARKHTGHVAQEVQAAMSDAGLDASDYAFWCSNTWWEAEETITKEDGETHTAIVPYQTEEDAPEGATKRTRLGIRYPELLGFVGAATEQRLADIEARIAKLEEGS